MWSIYLVEAQQREESHDRKEYGRKRGDAKYSYMCICSFIVDHLTACDEIDNSHGEGLLHACIA